MFYAHFILKKRGPLSRIWLAAHWDKKLTKAHIFETDIEGSVEAILSPQLKLALRTSSHLLLGVVRIYSRKAKYLLADCNEAFVKIKLAFRPGIVDLPAENREASLTTINIREDFTTFDLDVSDFNDIDFHSRFAVNQSRPEDITMREEVACLPYVGDDGFVDYDKLGGPVTMEAIELLLKQFNASRLDCCDEILLRKSDTVFTLLSTPQKLNRNASIADSGFGSPSMWTPDVCTNSLCGSSAFFSGGSNLASKFLECDHNTSMVPDMHVNASQSKTRLLNDTQGSGDFGFNPGFSAIPEVSLDDILFDQNIEQDEIRPTELLREQEARHSEDDLGKIEDHIAADQHECQSVGDDDCNYDDICDDDESINNDAEGTKDDNLFSEVNATNLENQLLYEEPTAGPAVDRPSHPKASECANDLIVRGAFSERSHTDLIHPNVSEAVVNDLTTLIENDEAFALGPVEVNIKERKTRRKRRLIIDEHKVISSETMKGQLSDSSELITPLDLAPPTKKLMQWKESGGVDKLFVLPGIPLISNKLFKRFSRNLVTKPLSNDDTDVCGASTNAESSRIEDENEPVEAMRDQTSELSQNLFSSGLVDKDMCPEADTTSCHEQPSPLRGDSTLNLNRELELSLDKTHVPDLTISCLDQLADLPINDSALIIDEIQPGANKQDGSPSRKRLKKSNCSIPPALPTLVTSDFEDDVENEDAIFDVELAPTCSEKTNLRQELEEAGLEERLWNRRSTQMQHILQRRLEKSSATSFRQLTNRNNRKQAASKFYTILVLTKAGAITVEQHEPYSDILISRGPAFSCML